jgi:hypothetical protein
MLLSYSVTSRTPKGSKMKTRLLLLTTVLVLTGALLSAPQPAKATAQVISYKLTCSSFTATGSTISPYLELRVYPLGIGALGHKTLKVDSSGVATGTVSFAHQPEGTILRIGVSGAKNSNGDPDSGADDFEAKVPCHDTCTFTDGRLNCHDAGQTAAVYCESDGSVVGLAIYKGVGYPAFIATKAEIDAVPANPEKNTLIKEGNGAFLYRLTSGQLQVNRAEDGTGKTYSFKFTCP